MTGWVLPDDYWWSHVAAHCWAGSLVCSLKLPGCQRTHYCQHSGGGAASTKRGCQPGPEQWLQPASSSSTHQPLMT